MGQIKEINNNLREKQDSLESLRIELSNAKEEIEKAKHDEITQKEKHAASKTLSEKLQNELNQERVNISTQKGMWEQQMKEINDALKEKQSGLDSLTTELSNAKIEIEKAKHDEIAQKEKHAASKTLSEKLQNQLDHERVNISTQK